MAPFCSPNGLQALSGAHFAGPSPGGFGLATALHVLRAPAPPVCSRSTLHHLIGSVSADERVSALWRRYTSCDKA